MIEVDISAEKVWQSEAEWQILCEGAIAAAIAASPFSNLNEAQRVISVSIRFADNDEVQTLNRDFRQKDKPTNILSFPMLEAEEIAMLHTAALSGGLPDQTETLLGDMILANAVCAAEASEKAIPLTQHVTHLIVHGMLHLLGYDHIDDREAETMEALEVKALASMGLPNPYI